MILLDKEDKFPSPYIVYVWILLGKTAQVFKVSSATKRFRYFDLEKNYLLAPRDLGLTGYFRPDGLSLTFFAQPSMTGMTLW